MEGVRTFTIRSRSDLSNKQRLGLRLDIRQFPTMSEAHQFEQAFAVLGLLELPGIDVICIVW